MAVVHSRNNLPEEMPGLPFRDVPPVADVVIQIPSAGVLHHYYNFVLVLKYWKTERKVGGGGVSLIQTFSSVAAYLMPTTSIIKTVHVIWFGLTRRWDNC